MGEYIMRKESVYFDFQAESGLTKHIGGTKATDELVRLCHIEQRDSILDVGCGVGLTPIYLAKEHGVVVSGVDINTGMIESACEYAKKDGVKEDTHFSLGDAQALPFSEGSFDAVICESVLVFLPLRERALEEFIRVTKSGGYVGFTESIWRGTAKRRRKSFSGLQQIHRPVWRSTKPGLNYWRIVNSSILLYMIMISHLQNKPGSRSVG